MIFEDTSNNKFAVCMNDGRSDQPKYIPSVSQVYEQLDLLSCSLEDKLDPKGSAISSLSTTSSVIKCSEKGLGKKTVYHLCDYVLVIAFQINLYIIFDRKGTISYTFHWQVVPLSYLELASFLTAVNVLSFLRLLIL